LHVKTLEEFSIYARFRVLIDNGTPLLKCDDGSVLVEPLDKDQFITAQKGQGCTFPFGGVAAKGESGWES
jgi:hypothetical protein